MKENIKTFLKAIIGLVFMVIFLGLITFTIDNSRISTGKSPIVSILISTQNDGGTKKYYGIGYKIIAYNKLNGYNKSHIGTYNLQYDETLGEESELAKLCKESVNKMNKSKLKNTVEFNKKEIKNKDKFLLFIDAVTAKDIKRHELNFITKTKKGKEIKHTLIYENNEMFYTIDKRLDENANELEKEALLTYEVEPLIKEKQSEDKKRISFYVIKKSNAEDELLVEVPITQLKERSD